MTTAIQEAIFSNAGYLIKYKPTADMISLLNRESSGNKLLTQKDCSELVVPVVQVTLSLRERFPELKNFIDCELYFDSGQDCYFAVHAFCRTPNKEMREAYPA